MSEIILKIHAQMSLNGVTCSIVQKQGNEYNTLEINQTPVAHFIWKEKVLYIKVLIGKTANDLDKIITIIEKMLKIKVNNFSSLNIE